MLDKNWEGNNLALEKINSVEIENFRSFENRREFNFESGFNLISGENGSGKTSLRLAIVLGLFSRVSGMGLQSIMRGSNHPQVKIEFVANNTTYTIEKSFSKSSKTANAVLVNIESNEKFSITEEAIVKCRQLVSGTIDSSINTIKGQFAPLHDEGNKKGELTKMLGDNMGSLLFPEQGRLVELFETNDVLRTIGLDENTLHTNNDLEKLIARADDERRQRLMKAKYEFECDVESGKRKNLAKNEILDSLYGRAKALKDSLEKIEEMKVKLQGFYSSLETKRSEEESITDGVDLEGQARTLEESAEDHQKRREEAEAKTTASKEDLSETQTQLDKRDVLKKKIDDLFKEIEINKSKLKGLEEDLKTNAKEHKLANEERKRLGSEKEKLEEWSGYENDSSYRKELEKKISESKEVLKNIVKQKKGIKKIQKEMSGIKIASKEQWKTINNLTDNINELRGSLSPWDMSQSSPPDGFTITIDGEEHTGSEGQISSSIIMKDSEDEVVISIINPAQSRSISDLEQELKSLYASLGAEKGERGELNARKEKYQALEDRMKSIKAKDYGSKGDIEDEISDAEDKLKTQKKKNV